MEFRRENHSPTWGLGKCFLEKMTYKMIFLKEELEGINHKKGRVLLAEETV